MTNLILSNGKYRLLRIVPEITVSMKSRLHQASSVASLEELAEDTQRTLKDEDAIMAGISYSGLAEHQAVHNRITRKGLEQK
jgi:hemerythrin